MRRRNNKLTKNIFRAEVNRSTSTRSDRSEYLAVPGTFQKHSKFSRKIRRLFWNLATEKTRKNGSNVSASSWRILGNREDRAAKKILGGKAIACLREDLGAAEVISNYSNKYVLKGYFQNIFLNRVFELLCIFDKILGGKSRAAIKML